MEFYTTESQLISILILIFHSIFQSCTDSTIIILDDDPDNYAFLTTAFSDLNLRYKFINICNGSQFFNFLEKWIIRNNELPDLILIDLQMPNLNGMETLKKLRLDTRFYTIPVVVNTSYLDDKDEKELYNWGVSLCNKKKCSLRSISNVALKIHNFFKNPLQI